MTTTYQLPMFRLLILTGHIFKSKRRRVLIKSFSSVKKKAEIKSKACS